MARYHDAHPGKYPSFLNAVEIRCFDLNRGLVVLGFELIFLCFKMRALFGPHKFDKNVRLNKFCCEEKCRHIEKTFSTSVTNAYGLRPDLDCRRDPRRVGRASDVRFSSTAGVN